MHRSGEIETDMGSSSAAIIQKLLILNCNVQLSYLPPGPARRSRSFWCTPKDGIRYQDGGKGFS
jgi:hypothetical protein